MPAAAGADQGRVECAARPWHGRPMNSVEGSPMVFILPEGNPWLPSRAAPAIGWLPSTINLINETYAPKRDRLQ